MTIPVKLIVFFAICIVIVSIVLIPRPSQIGQALELSGRLDDAVAYYQRALEADPEDEVTRIRLGSVFQLRGEPERAAEAYRYLIALNPDDIGYHRLLAELEEWNLRIDESMAQKGKIAALDRRDIAIRADLADYEVLHHKDYAAAIRYTEEAVAARPHDMQLLLELAQLYAQAKRIPESIATYERAIEEDATDPAAQRGLARVRAWDDQARAAIAQAQTAASQNPGDQATVQRLHDVLLSAGQDAAAQELEQRFPGLAAQ